MIRKAVREDTDAISKLWNEAFGDRIEDVLFYLDSIIEYFVLFTENEEVLGMLSVLPVTLKEKRGGYIYAVATRKAQRGKGICRKLLNYVKESMPYDFLILVPSDKGLFDFYKKSGFVEVTSVSKGEIIVYKTDSKSELKPIDALQYKNIRKEFFDKKELVEWNGKFLEFARNMYDGEFYELTNDGESLGAALCYIDNGTLYIKELLSENPDKAAEEMGSLLKTGRVIYQAPDFTTPSAMIYPEKTDNLYFGIALD